MNEELKKLAERMASQDNRGTQYPIFVVAEDQKVYVGRGGDWEERERNEEADNDDLCKSCVALRDADEDIPDDCDQCLDSAFYYYRIEEVFHLRTGFFMTAEECEDHIKENAYHYTNPRSYCVSAWRNPEIKMLMHHIFKETGVKMPNFYL